jgi:hypothetical protein
VTFATPLGLLALVSIPTIIVIHIFRRRYPVRTIAGLFLWQTAVQTPAGGGRPERLPITPGLLLECMAALALSLMLAGARCAPAGDVEHLVVLLDDSASMSARNGNGEPARDRAAREVTAQVDGMSRTARVTLVRSGERPAVLAGPATSGPGAREALERWQPRAPHHSLATGLRLARELAGRSGRLMVVSDVMPEDEAPAGVLWKAVGQPVANVGIIAAERTILPEKGQGLLLLTLGNYSEAEQSRTLTVVANGREVSRTTVTAPSGVSAVRLPLPPGLPAVQVTLSDDALRRDNEVVLVEPRPRLVAVDNELRDGRGRDALARALSGVVDVTSSDNGHLQFLESDAFDTPRQPGVWRVAFGAPPAHLRGDGQPEDFIGPFVLEKRHPLLLGVTLNGVVWTKAWPLRSSSGRPLASAADRPLLADVTAPGLPTSLLFNLDLETTNLIRSPDWPILVSNLIELTRQSLPGPERWNYRVGEWVRVRLDAAPKSQLLVKTASGERTMPVSRSLEFTAPEGGGLLQILADGKTAVELGTNFLDEQESDLRGRTSGQGGAFAPRTAGTMEAGVVSDPLFWILLVTAAAAMLANWCLRGMDRRLA